LELPSLAERIEDIPLLANTFLKTFNQTYNKKIKGITPKALQMLVEHTWEGNVRELKHTIERAVLLEEEDWLTEDDFEFESRRSRQTKKKVIATAPETSPSSLSDTLMLFVPMEQASANEVQRQLTRKVLDHVGGNKLKAAKILKISRPRLDRILRNGKNQNEK
ncbi:MAG: two-component system response regulator, partial [Bacteroidota bacterium]